MDGAPPRARARVRLGVAAHVMTAALPAAATEVEHSERSATTQQAARCLESRGDARFVRLSGDFDTQAPKHTHTSATVPQGPCICTTISAVRGGCRQVCRDGAEIARQSGQPCDAFQGRGGGGGRNARTADDVASWWAAPPRPLPRRRASSRRRTCGYFYCATARTAGLNAAQPSRGGDRAPPHIQQPAARHRRPRRAAEGPPMGDPPALPATMDGGGGRGCGAAPAAGRSAAHSSCCGGCSVPRSASPPAAGGRATARPCRRLLALASLLPVAAASNWGQLTGRNRQNLATAAEAPFSRRWGFAFAAIQRAHASNIAVPAAERSTLFLMGGVRTRSACAAHVCGVVCTPHLPLHPPPARITAGRLCQRARRAAGHGGRCAAVTVQLLPL